MKRSPENREFFERQRRSMLDAIARSPMAAAFQRMTPAEQFAAVHTMVAPGTGREHDLRTHRPARRAGAPHARHA